MSGQAVLAQYSSNGSQCQIWRLSRQNVFLPLVIEGVIDAWSADTLKKQIAAVLVDLQKDDQIICFSNAITFKVGDEIVNSTGAISFDINALGVLVGGRIKAKEKNANLAIVIDDPRIQHIFQRTGLDQIFEIYDSKTCPISLV